MSFSVGTEPHVVGEIRQAIESIEPGAHIADGNLRLLRYGKDVAIGMVDSGELGDPATSDTAYRVQITGHAAGDLPTIGDVLTVTLNNVPPPTS
jgi:hypothetical protein